MSFETDRFITDGSGLIATRCLVFDVAPLKGSQGRGARQHHPGRGPAFLMLLLLPAGCSSGAPSLTLFGSYFPAWLACALMGTVGAIVARVIMVASGLSEVLPYQLGVCIALGVIVGLCAAACWYGL